MLQKILIAIDFSDTSANLVQFVFAFNKHFFAQLHFLHVFTLPYAITQETDEALAQYEAIKNGYIDKIWGFINEHKGDYHYDILIHATTGGELQAIIDHTQKESIDLLIIGNKEKGKWGRWLTGSISQQLLQKPPVHTLAISKGYLYKECKKIWACTDLSTPITDEQAYFIKYITDRLQAEVHFLHVTDTTERPMDTDLEAKTVIYRLFQEEPKIAPILDSIPHTIEQVIHQQGGDLLIVFPHQHNWLDAFFLGHETTAISSETEIPILSMKGMKR